MNAKLTKAGPAAKAPAGKSEPAAEGIRKQIRVLVVDDSMDMRDLLCDILDRRGYRTAQAKDGLEGLEMFRSGSYDVVVSDYHMPVMDGLELLRQIKRLSPGTPVIMGFGGEDSEFEAAKDAGASAVLRKPYGFADLERAIEKALS